MYNLPVKNHLEVLDNAGLQLLAAQGQCLLKGSDPKIKIHFKRIIKKKEINELNFL